MQDILQEAVLQIGSPLLHSVLASAEIQYQDENNIQIKVPTAFAEDMLKRHLGDLKKQLREATGKEIALKVSIDRSIPIPEVPPPEDKERTPDSASTPKREPHYHITLKPELNFDTFKTGKVNEFVCRVALDFARWNPKRTPLLIQGSSGSGKTHLLQAIGNEAQGQRPRARVVYVNAEPFMKYYSRVSRKETPEWEKDRFKQRHFEADMLILDDLHLFAEDKKRHDWVKSRFQMRMILKELIEVKGAFVVVATVFSVENLFVEDELKSILRGIRTYHLPPPDYELRVAIIVQKARERDLSISETLAQMIIERISFDARSIKGALDKISDYRDIRKEDPSEETVRLALGENAINPKITVAFIRDAVARRYRLAPQALNSSRDAYTMAWPAAIFLCNEMIPGTSIYELADVFETTPAKISALITAVRERDKVHSYLWEEIQAIREELAKV